MGGVPSGVRITALNSSRPLVLASMQSISVRAVSQYLPQYWAIVSRAPPGIDLLGGKSRHCSGGQSLTILHELKCPSFGGWIRAWTGQFARNNHVLNPRSMTCSMDHGLRVHNPSSQLLQHPRRAKMHLQPLLPICLSL